VQLTLVVAGELHFVEPQSLLRLLDERGYNVE